MTHQAQERLLHLDAQIAHMHAQVERLITDATAANSQVTVLVRHLTDPHALQAVHQPLAELGGQAQAHRAPVHPPPMKLAERGGRAAELLPALDSVELALASGQALLHQQRQQIAAWDQQQASTPQQGEPRPSATGIWRKLRLPFTGQAAPVSSTPQERPRLPD